MKTIFLFVLLIISTSMALAQQKIGLTDGTVLVGTKTGEDSKFLYFEELNTVEHSLPIEKVEYISDITLVEITMTSGTVVAGYVEKITDTKIVLSYPGFGESEFYRSNIEYVKPYQEKEEDIRLRNMPEEKVVEEFQIKKASYLFDYPVIGATIGLPGVYNILMGYYSYSLMINGTFGLYGASISPGFVLSHREHLSFSLCADLSYTDIDDIKSLILGPSFELNTHGFFIEIGFGFPLEESSYKIIPDFQIGFVYRFNKYFF